MRYLVRVSWLRFLDDEEQEVFEVEAADEEEARRTAEPKIGEYAATLGCPTFVGVEEAKERSVGDAPGPRGY